MQLLNRGRACHSESTGPSNQHGILWRSAGRSGPGWSRGEAITPVSSKGPCGRTGTRLRKPHSSADQHRGATEPQRQSSESPLVRKLEILQPLALDFAAASNFRFFFLPSSSSLGLLLPLLLLLLLLLPLSSLLPELFFFLSFFLFFFFLSFFFFAFLASFFFFLSFFFAVTSPDATLAAFSASLLIFRSSRATRSCSALLASGS
mmetsp:Transcript_92980/g.208116  ORF Transcript_92980/g.208116 Transcript_92980/m.208116 type:complete len:205 (-) Transcript_92980:136-750(-)